MASPKTNALVSGGTFAGVDQGIDFTGGPFNIFALGDGIITRLESSGSGWPGQGALLTYKVTSGPAAGKYVYVAEDFNPAAGLGVGSPVKQGQVIGQATGSGQAPGIEIGFADPSGHAFGEAFTPSGGRAGPQPMGRLFLQTVEMLSSIKGAPFTGGSGLYDPATGKPLQPPAAGTGGISSSTPGVGGIISAGKGVVSATESVGSFIGKLTDPNLWLRGLQMAAGAFLVAVGLYLLARQVGLAPSVSSIPTPIAAASEAVA